MIEIDKKIRIVLDALDPETRARLRPLIGFTVSTETLVEVEDESEVDDVVTALTSSAIGAAARSCVPYAQRAYIALNAITADDHEKVSDEVIREADQTADRTPVAELAKLVAVELDHLRNEIARAIAPGGRASWLRIDTAEQIHTPITAKTDDGPILAWDAVAADWLETRLGATDEAAELRKDARIRWTTHERQRDLLTPGHEPTVASLWHLWRGSLPIIVYYVARATWHSEKAHILSRLEFDVSKKHPAFVFGLLRATSFSGPPQVENGRLISHGHHTGLELVTPAADSEALHKAFAHLHTIPAHRTVRWIAKMAYLANRARAAGVAHEEAGIRAEALTGGGSVFVTIQGGKSALAEAVGCSNPRDHKLAYDTLLALSRVRVEWYSAETEGATSLTFELKHMTGGGTRTGSVRVGLSELWSPGAYGKFPKGSVHRHLVPVLDLPPMPRKLERYHPALAALDARAIEHLTAHSDVLWRDGGVRIPWPELAREVGVTPEALRAALDRWTQDGDDGEARWVEQNGRWTLADRPPLEGARKLLAAGGEDRKKRSELGKRSAAARKKPR